MKKALTIGLTVVLILTLAMTVFAQDMTHQATYELDGTIELEKQVGHLCNTGAEMKQTIYGEGEMSKVMDTAQVKGKITVDDSQNWVTAEGALRNLTVTSVIELCAPAKHEYTTTHFVPVATEAVYDDERYTLTMAVVGTGTATDLTDSGPYAAGDVVDIEAVAGPDFVFLQWTVDPTGTGSFGNINDPNTTFTMPANDVIVTAVFYDEGSVDFRDQTWPHRCGDWGAFTTGRVGTTVDTWDISAVADGAIIDFRYDAYSIPDRFIVEYNGVQVHDTGWRGSPGYDGDPLYPGGIVGPGAGQEDALFTKVAGVDEFTVTVYAPQTGTLWEYELRCRLTALQ